MTFDDPRLAESMVETLLAARLVACGQVLGPMVSRYWWDGSVERASEWLVLLKTREELAPEVVDAVATEHPYDTPEIIVMPISGGHGGYLGWLEETTRTPEG